LNAFIVDCMTGIVFKDHSQIQQFYCEKKFDWWPQTRILIRPLPG
jgi:Holliday junction resolvase RusA-like endonuclease